MLYKKITLIRAAIITIGLTGTIMQASHASTEPKKHQEIKISNTVNFSEFSLLLKPSSLGGIGVFAAHDIPSGTLLFTSSHEMRTLKTNDIPQEFRKYCIFVSDEECICPEQFDRMEIGWYINHSNTPNIDYDFNLCKLYAINDIKAGDEILIDYNYLGEPEHLKESYYQSSVSTLEEASINNNVSQKNAPSIDRKDPDIKD
jgi:SET domain-containing protein